MEKDRSATDIPLPRAYSSDLRGRQSVRATFKLSERTINTITIVATHLGIQQKSLFDHLIEDIQSLSSIAKGIRHMAMNPEDRIQKTYVMSRRSLTSLDKIARDFHAPRDALVEYSIQRLLPVILTEKEKHEKRKEILGELVHHLKEGKGILKKSENLLGKDDPVYEEILSAMTALENTCHHIGLFIERGKIIEAFLP